MRIVVCVKQVYDPKTVKISRSREELDLRDAVKILIRPISMHWRRRCACTKRPGPR